MTNLSLLPELAEVAEEGTVVREAADAVDPVRSFRLSCTASKASSTAFIAASIAVISLLISAFSASVQVTDGGVAAISFAKVAMELLEGSVVAKVFTVKSEMCNFLTLSAVGGGALNAPPKEKLLLQPLNQMILT